MKHTQKRRIHRPIHTNFFSSPHLPLRTVVIEDSEIGLTAAKAAGMKCIVTKSSYTKNENFHNADLVIDELGEGAGALPFQAIKDLAFK